MLKGNLIVNRGIYHVKFRVKDENGEVKQKLLSTGIKAVKGNKRKAEERMNEILQEYEEKAVAKAVETEEKLSKAIYLPECVLAWIERNKRHVAVTTYDGYLHMFNKHIKPYFESDEHRIAITDLKPMHLEDYYNYKIESGLSPNTVIKHGAIIRTALQDALKNELILSNPADLAKKPKRKEFKHNFYTETQLVELWNLMQDTPLQMPVYFAIFFGLRRSEAVGVKWSAIDFEKRLITIDCKIVRTLGEGKVKFIESDTMKTEASKSVYPINDANYAYLKAVKAHQEAMTRLTNEYAEYVCVNEIGELIQPDYVTHRFKELLEKFGLPHIRFHDLRHSCLSFLANDKNFTMKQVQEYARHANYQTTADIYSHVDVSVKAAELDALTAMLMPDLIKEKSSVSTKPEGQAKHRRFKLKRLDKCDEAHNSEENG